jgi:divalent metal cation (Fe/Co/Zn/Cd) transporter
MPESTTSEQRVAIATAVRLETASMIWMGIEAAIAIGAGIVAGSLLLVAFGIDSIIELASAIAVFRRFRLESIGREAGARTTDQDLEDKTARIAGYLLFLLSIYVLAQAIFGLVTRHAAESSPVGIAVAVVAAFGMPVLAKAKLRVAERLASRALRADAMETITCGYLSWILLAGLAINAATHRWWIDSVASLAIVPFLVREGYEAVQGRCC